MEIKDTIVAISTAVGNGGVGIIRVSGADAAINELAGLLFQRGQLQPRYAYLLPLRDNGELVDKAIVLYFKAPFSYTGESVLEIQAHGGMALLNWIIEIILGLKTSFPVRMANPGEFTERAFLNGKLDLVQCEAVADLISASSKNAIKAASRSMTGEFSQKIHGVSDQITNLRVQVEAILDFPEEEIDFLTDYKIRGKTEAVLQALTETLRVSEQGEILREGVRVAIVGATNVGKSSLLNAIAGDEIAIVSDVEGTTRDKVQTQIFIEGIPFHIIDTAGIRNTEDAVEKIGISRSKDEITKADVILRIQDASRQNHESDDLIFETINALTREGTPIIYVLNKIDLVDEAEAAAKYPGAILASAKTKRGLDELKKELLKISGWSNDQSVYFARKRQVDDLKSAKEHISTALYYLKQEAVSLELIAEELRLAGSDLGDIVGETTSDDLLGKIFAGFCIGK
jgi:tRNA modification GTPase